MVGWDYGGGDISTIADSMCGDQNIIKKYGFLSVQEMQTLIGTYLIQYTRQTRNNQMMIQCLFVSLADKRFNKISYAHRSYMENNVESATLLFKLLMQKSMINTRARTYQLCCSLDNLDHYMVSVNSNIELFNLHVKNTHEDIFA